MESDICSGKMRNEVVDSSLEMLHSEKNSDVNAKNLELVDGKAILEPITPDPDRENGGDALSPLTRVSSLGPPRVVVVVCSDLTHNETTDFHFSPRTPKEDVFDPFAPGPDDLILAPRCIKYLEGTQINVVRRRLNFNSSIEFLGNDDDDDDDEDDRVQDTEELFLESVYESFLDAIVSKQAEEGPVDESLSKRSGSDGCETPTLLPLLNGIAETCPRAPKKPATISKIIDQRISRKLEF